MRFAIGTIHCRNNTFSAATVPSNQLNKLTVREDAAILERHHSAPTTLGGALEQTQSAGIEVVPTIEVSVPPGGTISTNILDTLIDRLCERITGPQTPVDAMILELSGATTTDDGGDGDAHIVDRIRRASGRRLPIGLLVDFRANLSRELVDQADFILPPYSVPETNGRERGARLVQLLESQLRQQSYPMSALRHVPILVPLTNQSTGSGPLAIVAQRAQEIRLMPNVLTAAVTAGFPYADTRRTGAAAIVTTDGDPEFADRLAESLAGSIWRERDKLAVSSHLTNAEEAVHQGMAARDGLTVLADTGDDPGAGAPGDGTGLLWALLDLGARGAALAPLVDPVAVQTAIDVGVGGHVEIAVGARTDRRHGYPIDISARVLRISDGRFTRLGPLAAGEAVDLGRTVVLRVEGRHDGDVELIVTERPWETDDAAIFQANGIQVREKQILAVKSSARYRLGFAEFAARMIEVATPGITVPEFGYFDFHHLRRPIYPLDSD